MIILDCFAKAVPGMLDDALSEADCAVARAPSALALVAAFAASAGALSVPLTTAIAVALARPPAARTPRPGRHAR